MDRDSQQSDERVTDMLSTPVNLAQHERLGRVGKWIRQDGNRTMVPVVYGHGLPSLTIDNPYRASFLLARTNQSTCTNLRRKEQWYRPSPIIQLTWGSTVLYGS